MREQIGGNAVTVPKKRKKKAATVSPNPYDQMPNGDVDRRYILRQSDLELERAKTILRAANAGIISTSDVLNYTRHYLSDAELGPPRKMIGPVHYIIPPTITKSPKKRISFKQIKDIAKKILSGHKFYCILGMIACTLMMVACPLKDAWMFGFGFGVLMVVFTKLVFIARRLHKEANVVQSPKKEV